MVCRAPKSFGRSWTKRKIQHDFLHCVQLFQFSLHLNFRFSKWWLLSASEDCLLIRKVNKVGPVNHQKRKCADFDFCAVFLGDWNFCYIRLIPGLLRSSWSRLMLSFLDAYVFSIFGRNFGWIFDCFSFVICPFLFSCVVPPPSLHRLRPKFSPFGDSARVLIIESVFHCLYTLKWRLKVANDLFFEACWITCGLLWTADEKTTFSQILTFFRLERCLHCWSCKS